MKMRGKFLWEVLSVFVGSIIAIPIYMVFVNSLKSKAEAADMGLGFPKHWDFIDNYRRVFVDGQIPQAFYNTTLITVLSVIFIVYFCSTSAFVIHRRESPFTRLLTLLFIFALILPSSIITTYVLMNDLHLVRTYLGVVLLYIAGHFAFGTYVYTSFFYGVPKELDEAAIIDGVGPYRLFFTIIFPLLKPIHASVIIIMFMNVWNDFTTPLYFLNTAKRFTLSLAIYFFYGAHSADWNLIFADIVIISLPVILLYLFLQRYIVDGLTTGAVKS